MSYRPLTGAVLAPKINQIFKSLFAHNSEDARSALACFLSVMLGEPVSKVAINQNKIPIKSEQNTQPLFELDCKINAFHTVLPVKIHAENNSIIIEYSLRIKTERGLRSEKSEIIYLELSEYEDIPDIPLQKLTAVEKWAKFFLYINCIEKIEYMKMLAESESGIMHAKKILDLQKDESYRRI